MKPEILFLKQEDTIAAGVLDMKMVLEVTEKTFKMLGENQIINPAKTMLPMPTPENWTSFCMSMPAYIGGDVDMAGFKWASESVYNATQPNMPYGLDVVMLSDPKTVYPKAIMDGTIITAMRTSAAAGVCAKYMARKNSEIACLVGAGVIGRTMVMSMMEAVPQLKEIRMVDLDLAKAKALAAEFAGKYNVVAYDSVEVAAKDADIVVTQTTARKPFLKTDWVKKNATVIQMSAYEIEDDFMAKADKIVLDNWEQLSHGVGCLVRKLHEEGKLNREDVSLMEEMVTGKAPSRESDDELIVCATFGVGSVDIAVANALYEVAKAKGIGQKLLLWDNLLWE